MKPSLLVAVQFLSPLPTLFLGALLLNIELLGNGRTRVGSLRREEGLDALRRLLERVFLSLQSNNNVLVIQIGLKITHTDMPTHGPTLTDLSFCSC